MLVWEKNGIVPRDSGGKSAAAESIVPKVPWYGGKFVPVEEAFKPIPYNEAAAKHFTREEIDALNEKGRLAFESRPKQMRYIPPDHLSKRAQKEIFHRRGFGPFVRYVEGGRLTRKEVDEINEDYAKNMADPGFKPLDFGPLRRDPTHVDLMTLSDYSEGWFSVEKFMEQWKAHFKECYVCANTFVFFEERRLNEAPKISRV